MKQLVRNRATCGFAKRGKNQCMPLICILKTFAQVVEISTFSTFSFFSSFHFIPCFPLFLNYLGIT